MKQQIPTSSAPSKKPTNQCKNPKVMGNFYVCGVITFIVVLYITTIYLGWMDVGTVFYLLIVHISFFMFLWSFAKTIITDPGRVPLHWGFYLDDPDHKKKRYCLVCHIFKPERCHHCSVCNRCVLNMDHHCPWINNCVGFYNRKFFILMLFYVVLTSFILLCGEIKLMYVVIEEIIEYCDTGNGDVDWALDFFIFLGCIGATTIFFIIVCFFKFHCTLIYNNMTTIEHLDNKRGTSIPSPSASTINYDIGFKYNFYQIFGKNSALWLFPMFLESGKPVGDGVVWLQRYKESNDHFDNSSDFESSKKNITVGNDEKYEEKPKKSANIQPSPQRANPNLNSEESRRPNIFGFSDKTYGFQQQNFNSNNFSPNSYPQPGQGLIEMSPPQRLLMPTDNILIEERNSNIAYSDYKPNDTSYLSRNFDRGDNLGMNNQNLTQTAYGLTGYSQPNQGKLNFSPQKNNEFLGLRNKSTLDRYGYNNYNNGN